jgi:hypothetical protein
MAAVALAPVLTTAPLGSDIPSVTGEKTDGAFGMAAWTSPCGSRISIASGAMLSDAGMSGGVIGSTQSLDVST